MRFKSLFVLSTIAFTTLIVPASASSFCDRSSEVQQAQICSYSLRQCYLAQAVSQLVYNYYQRTGQVLPVTSQTVTEIMQLIGATNSEAAFVVDRMVAHTRAIATHQAFR